MTEKLKDIFIKGCWNEKNIIFYFHFQDNEAVRQIEDQGNKAIYLSVENPVKGESILCDQSFENMETKEIEFITQKEFETEWSKHFVS